MSRIDTMKLIQKTSGVINKYYDARIQNFLDIRDNSTGTYDLIRNGFIFGYAQGMKAAEAARKER